VITNLIKQKYQTFKKKECQLFTVYLFQQLQSLKMITFTSMLKTLKIIFLLAIIALLSSCQKDFEKPNWDVDLLLPLVKSTLTLADLIPDSLIQTNPDTSLKLVYNTNVFDVDMDSLFTIPDTTIADVYTIPLSSIAAPGNSFYSTDEELKMNINNGVELNEVKIESGFIEIEIFSEIKEKIIITYTIPSATLNGDTLVLSETVDAWTPSQDGYIKKIIDISGYTLDLTGVSNTKVNTLVTRAEGVVDTNATSSVLISIGEKITYNNTMRDIVPFYVKGYFGSQQYTFGPEITQLAIFDKIVGGTIDFNQVDVNLDFDNGFGIDAQLIMNQFTTINTNSGGNASLVHSIMGTPLNLNRAQETFSVTEVNYSNYNVFMNTANSNIDQLIEVLPNQLQYEIDMNINPLGNVSGGNDFVFKKHPLKVNLNVEFPLSLIASNLTLADTVDLSLSSDNSKREIIDGTLFLYAENGFPFDAAIVLDMYDDNMNFIKTLTVNSQILAAPVDANFRVFQKKSSKVNIPLSSSDIDDLYKAGKMVVKIAFTTQPQTQFLKIYEEYVIDIKLVGDFSYNVNPN
jgi:hypothetical protein